MSATENTSIQADEHFRADMIHSTQELRTWFQVDPLDYTTFIGMSCCITRDGQGNITDVKFYETGVVMHV